MRCFASSQPSWNVMPNANRYRQVMYRAEVLNRQPRKNEILNLCWFVVGPPSVRLAHTNKQWLNVLCLLVDVISCHTEAKKVYFAKNHHHAASCPCSYNNGSVHAQHSATMV